MPPDEWTTRHPELVHWLQHAEDELIGYAPIDDIPLPTAVFPERLLPFFVVISSPMGQEGPPRHQWTSMDCLYSQADIETLRIFFARVHGVQDPFITTGQEDYQNHRLRNWPGLILGTPPPLGLLNGLQPWENNTDQV